jgi:hypothetical protein
LFILSINCYIFSMVVIITCFLYQKTKYFCWWQILKSFHMATFMWMITYNTIHPLYMCVEELSLLILLPTHVFSFFLLQDQIRTRKIQVTFIWKLHIHYWNVKFDISIYNIFSKSFILYISQMATKPLYTYNFIACNIPFHYNAAFERL